jgi:hypothetical protein
MQSSDQFRLKRIEKALSRKRLTRYMAMSNGDLAQAIELHRWNTSLGAALHFPMQTFELLFRNTLNDSLTSKFGSNWYDVKFQHLELNSQKQIEAAKDQLISQGRQATAPAVIAQFSFGFWLSLLAKRNETRFWVTTLHSSFPQAPRSLQRAAIYNAVNDIRLLRNRIAHHEPIYNRNLSKDFQHLITVSSWLCPATADWIKKSEMDLLEAIAKKPITNRP